MNSLAFTVNGKVKEVDSSYLNKIYETHPEMKDIDATDTDSSKDTLRPFAIEPIDGQVYY